jgi:hypothetical protein
MKHTLLKTTLLILGAVVGLHAQTSTILIKSGDPINGASSNSAKLLSMGNIVMNENGGIAFQGYATESVYLTNVLNITNRTVTSVTNLVPVTNTIVTVQTNFVPDTIRVVTAQTNRVATTNNLTGATNTFQITYTTNSVVIQRPIYVYSTNVVSTNRTSITYSTNTSVVTTNQVVMTNYNGIWTTGTNGQFNLVARTGMPILGSTNSLNYLTDPVLNDNGASAFIGYSYATNGFSTNKLLSTNTLTGVISTNTFTNPIIALTNSTIYLAFPNAGPNNLLPVATIGSPAPGTSANFTSFSNLALPDVGGVIFVGMAGTNQGVWAQDASATVRLIASRGQTISVGGTNKVISSFSMMNNGFPGVTRSYSDDTGAIVFQAYFTDGTSAAIQVNR